MRIASILLFGATIFSPLINADTSSSTSLSPEDKPSQVLVLTDDNFDATLTARSLLLVKFYTPWCSYCKELAPEYESAAASLGDMANNVTMAEVDCSVHEELCIDQDIGSFPTIKLFRHGIPTIYDGPRHAHALTRYLFRQTLPAVTLLTPNDQYALDTLRRSDNIVVVGSGSSNTTYTTFKTLADEWRDRYLFGWVDGSEKVNSLVVYTRFDDDHHVDVYTGDDYSIDSIKMFIRHHATPLFGPIGPDTYLDYEEAALPLAYLFIDSTSMLTSYQDSMMAFAQRYRGVINFVYIDAIAYPEQADYLGITTTTTPSWPAFVIQDTDYNNRYVLPPQPVVTSGTIQDHITGFLDHTLTPYLLSDPIPETPMNGNVQIVVGSQFHDLVTLSDQDVLLKVYAPWCSHCKKLAPVWQQLAQLVHDQSYPLRVASMDGTSNDFPVNDPAATFDVDVFPTIVFIQAHTHRVALYSANDGDRSLASLVKFIHEQKENTVDLQLQLPINNDNLVTDDLTNGTSNEEEEEQQQQQQQQQQQTDDDDNDASDNQNRVSQIHDEL